MFALDQLHFPTILCECETPEHDVDNSGPFRSQPELLLDIAAGLGGQEAGELALESWAAWK